VEIPVDHTLELTPVGAEDVTRAPATAAWMIGLIAAVYNGVAIAARDWLVRYLNERAPSNLGAPLASLPRFQSTVGDIQAMLHVNRMLLDGLSEDTAAGRADIGVAGLVKVVVTRNAISSIEQGLALIGNPGLSYHHPLQRHYRDALCSRIHTPQDDSVLLALGRAALGGS
jgi:alkylation response protein AidB-like acyl-CoA dehydrogenase